MPHHVRPHHGIVTSRYKLVHFDGPDLNEWELFDCERDPHELQSVYNDPAYASIVADLKKCSNHYHLFLIGVIAIAFFTVRHPVNDMVFQELSRGLREPLSQIWLEHTGGFLVGIGIDRPVLSETLPQASVKRCECGQKQECGDTGVNYGPERCSQSDRAASPSNGPVPGEIMAVAKSAP